MGEYIHMKTGMISFSDGKFVGRISFDKGITAALIGAECCFFRNGKEEVYEASYVSKNHICGEVFLDIYFKNEVKRQRYYNFKFLKLIFITNDKKQVNVSYDDLSNLPKAEFREISYIPARLPLPTKKSDAKSEQTDEREALKKYWKSFFVMCNNQLEGKTNQVDRIKDCAGWSVDETLYIYKGEPNCRRNKHTISQATAWLFTFNDREIELNVDYCKECRRFFINYSTYMYYREKYGALLGNLDLEYYKGGEWLDATLAEMSKLNLCGYNVGEEDSYTNEQRQYIISTIISRGIMEKRDVIRHLEHFIRVNGRRRGNERALSKWKADLEYTLKYDADKQKQVYLSHIIYRGQ